MNLENKEEYRTKLKGFQPKFKSNKASLLNRLKMLEKAQVKNHNYIII